jgi:hypothetical protein
LARSHLKRHGKCFFVLVLEEDLTEWQMLAGLPGEVEEKTDTTTAGNAVVFKGYQWLIPISRSMLPAQDVKNPFLSASIMPLLGYFWIQKPFFGKILLPFFNLAFLDCYQPPVMTFTEP